MNKTIWTAIVLLVLVFGVYWFWGRPAEPVNTYAVDPLNASYSLENKTVQLTSGQVSVDIVPGSASKSITKIFTSTLGDLNKDGVDDAAVILTQDNGGSGTFFYVAAAINNGNDTQGTNAIFLGDRISPQTLEIRDGKIIANYAERKPGEPMTAQPSVGVSKYFEIQNGSLVEVK